MAEIEFFADLVEVKDVVENLLEEGFQFVPDAHYETDTPVTLAEISGIREAAATTPHFFLIRKDLLESPISMRKVTAEGKQFYYVDPRTGGPTLQFLWGRGAAIDSSARDSLSASWISHYPWYTDSVSKERRPMPKSLIQVYSACAKNIRAKGRRIKPGKREYWLFPHAESLVRGGTKLVGLENLPFGEIIEGAA